MEFRLKLVAFSGLLALFVYARAVDGGYYDSICFKGQRQSPINLPKVYAKNVKPSKMLLSKGFFQDQDFDIENEHGHTLSGYLHNKGKLTARGDLMEGQKYIFNSFHLHWGPPHTGLGSDHHIAGKTYSTEMHYLFYHSNYTSKDAAVKSGNPRAIAVIGLLFQVGDKCNPYLEPIAKAARDVVDPHDETEGYGLNLAKLLYHGEYRYAYFGHYLGSLTTAPCDEVVMWNVKMNPLPICKDQLEALATLKDLNGKTLLNNFRSTRPVNGRKIEYFRIMPNRKM